MFTQCHTVYEKYESLNKYVLRCRLNVFTDEAFFTVSGSWFQKACPATENDLVPNTVLVAGRMSDSFEAERNVDRRDTLATGFL